MDNYLRKFFLIVWSIIALSFLILRDVFHSLSLPAFPAILTGAVIALILTIIFEKIFLSPLKQLQEISRKITSGNFQEQFSVNRKDALGDLANYLNQLSSELKSKIAQTIKDKNELQAILSSMVEAVIVIGKDERIFLMNTPVYAMLDLRSKDILGKPYWEVIRNEEINSLLKEAISQKKSAKKEISIISPSDNAFLVQVSPVLLNNGQLSAVVAVFHDVTELKKLARLRSEFVANVSHELKTPLTSIKGFVETLKDGALHDKEKAKKFLDIIQKHTDHLDNLVHDLLSLSAIESQEAPINFDEVYLVPIWESLIGLYRKQIETKKIKILTNFEKTLPSVSADRIKIEQVFLNLLDNAIKFTPQGGTIIISAYKDTAFVRTEIKDTGIGIAPEHLSRIFERFYRVDKGRSRDQGGTGLGLAIVKHIVQKHNGEISVHSEIENGTTFSVTLPILNHI